MMVGPYFSKGSIIQLRAGLACLWRNGLSEPAPKTHIWPFINLIFFEVFCFYACLALDSLCASLKCLPNDHIQPFPFYAFWGLSAVMCSLGQCICSLWVSKRNPCGQWVSCGQYVGGFKLIYNLLDMLEAILCPVTVTFVVLLGWCVF